MEPEGCARAGAARGSDGRLPRQSAVSAASPSRALINRSHSWSWTLSTGQQHI